MMNQTNGSMNGWMDGGMWTWSISGILLVVILLLVIKQVSKK